MVITCPACSSKYRLNPDKIKGRGAKITCPKCAHVFVVFAEGRSSATPEKTRAAAPSPTPPAGSPSVDRDGFSGRDKETTTGAFRAVGVEEDAIGASTSGQVRVVAPGPRKTRRVVAAISTNSNLRALPKNLAAPEEASAPAPPADPSAQSAADLDFRSVGISTWKVKVKIGLIYDFSDISTLKKYLADKKVTPDDLISHDGKDWTRIGDIEDLDAHFISVWTKAKADQKDDPAKPAKTSSTGTVKASSEATDAMRAAVKETGSFNPAATGSMRASSRGTSSRSSSTSRTGTNKRVAPPRPQKQGLSSNARLGILGVVGLLVLGGAYLGFREMERQRLIAQEAAASVDTTNSPSAAEMTDIERKIQEKLEAEADRIRQEEALKQQAARAEEAEPELVPVKQLEPVPPRESQPEQRERVLVSRDSVASSSTPQRSASPTREPQTNVRVKQAANPGGTYYTAGLKKLNSGDFAGAAKMLKLAVAKEPGNGNYHDALGKAYQGLGKSSEAATEFQKAKSLGGNKASANLRN